MSRTGKKPINIISGVNVDITDKASLYKGQLVTVTGPKGSIKVDLRPEVIAKLEEGILTLSIDESKPNAKALWGLYRSLLANAVEGVEKGFEKALELVGIGYKAELIGNKLSLKVGFSHSVIVEIPEGIKLELKDPTNIKVIGHDKQKVTQMAAFIRSQKKPEPYKGKGIRYAGEIIKKKSGKSATK